ncbi:hypothetical protein IWW36_001412 [Coemansia brasiliensis]|uniref:ADF-H domain-containing protein n=1 Tax=Coemansia brasiliensis TaxID=2650707 RepID=A0A9W8I933_9FUNG|nr:hypothetical protein IWW36_001412 [Coemansia brasiliensis]
MNKLPPAYWPANIIEKIVWYAVSNPVLVSNIKKSDFHAEKYYCKVANQATRYQSVCRNWANVVRAIVSKHLCLEIDSKGKVKSNNINLCSYNRMDKNNSAYLVKRACVKIEYDAINNNSFVKLWPGKHWFGNALHLNLYIAERDIVPTNDAENEANEEVSLGNIKEKAKLVSITLKAMFPNVKTVSIRQHPAPNSSRSLLISTIYNMFIKHVLSNSRSDDCNQCMPFNTAQYAAYSRVICTSAIQICRKLTSITLNAILSDENNYIALLHHNALTLRKLDLVCHLSLRCVGIIQDADENPIIYPHLEWLRIAVLSKTPFSNESELLKNSICFPQVRYLHLPGVYPFENFTLLQDKNHILDTLTLGVNKEFVESLQLHNLPKKYSALKSLKIVDTPATNMNFLPLVAQSSPITVDGLAKVLDLFSSSKLESLDINLSHMLKAVTNKSLNELVVTWNAGSLSTNWSFSHAVNLLATYTATLIMEPNQNIDVAYTVGYSKLLSKFDAPPKEIPYPFIGKECLANMSLFDKEIAKTAIFAINDGKIECHELLSQNRACSICKYIPQSECRYVVIRIAKRQKFKIGKKKWVTAVLLWLPKGAPAAERVEYKAHLNDLSRQIRHVDFAVHISEWNEFSRRFILSHLPLATSE